MPEEKTPEERARERRLDDLTERTAEDVTRLARESAGVARAEATEAGERAVWPGALAALGGLFVLFGAGVLAAAPAVPPRERLLKRRLVGLGLAYLVGGALGAGAGAALLGGEVSRALPRTRRRVRELLGAFRRRV